jgi:hypothetical protein
VLFGSRARGDARPDSDYDAAVFLNNMSDRFAELYRLADLSTDILGDTGEFVHAMRPEASHLDQPPLAPKSQPRCHATATPFPRDRLEYAR